MDLRAYDPARDREAVFRIYTELGWLQPTDRHRETLDLVLGAGRTLVALVDGAAECNVSCWDARIRHLGEWLPATVIESVVTSRVARHRGLGSRLTARAVAEEVLERGAAVATLGIFDQGFYDRLGFACGSTLHWWFLDPRTIDVPVPRRAPVRFGPDDHERVLAALLGRHPWHGRVDVLHPEVVRGLMLALPKGFGLGYEDGTGALTHFLWMNDEGGRNGPYAVIASAFRSGAEFRELMGLLRSFGDQVHLVRMREPPGVQLQEMLRDPFRRIAVGEKGVAEQRLVGRATLQFRICDLPACLAATRLPGPGSVRFRLRLADPIGDHLDDDLRSRWGGAGGEWDVVLGPESSARPATAKGGLPELRTSVGTFTKLWLGVAPPTALGWTRPDLEAPEDLLRDLEEALRLPPPYPDWDY